MNWEIIYYDKEDFILCTNVLVNCTKSTAKEKLMINMPNDCDNWTLLSTKKDNKGIGWETF